MKRPEHVRALPVIEEDALRRTAQIIGAFSAAGQALQEIAERRGRGEDPLCVSYGDSLLVFNPDKEGA